jgi:hypothetical protein
MATPSESGQAGALEITPAMVEAGVAELRGRMFGERLSEIATDVFIAMVSARQPSTVPLR